VSELGAGLLGAFFGAGLAYILDLRKAAWDRSHQAALAAAEHSKRRAAVATALLIDLRTLESTLRQFYKLKHSTKARGILPTLFFDRVEHELVFFGPETVSKVLAVYTSARDFFGVLENGKRGVKDDELGGDLDWAVRCKAGFAIQNLRPAVEALVQEGGVFPTERKVHHAFRPDLPAIGDRVFPLTLTEPATGLEEDIE
jgi:hypothetical protein